jgi:hypothetical protein
MCWPRVRAKSGSPSGSHTSPQTQTNGSLDRELSSEKLRRRGRDVAHPHVDGLLCNIDLTALALLGLVVELDLVRLLVRC